MRVEVGLVLVVVLAGCSQQGEVENALREHMKDPESAKFQRVLVSKKGDKACAVWNARNSFGGYGEWTTSELVKSSVGWHVSQIETSPERCTEEAYRAWDNFEKASDGLRKALNGASPETLKVMSEASKEEQEKQEAEDKALRDLVQGTGRGR